MATYLDAEDWLEIEGSWVETRLEGVVLVMKLACSDEVADIDDCDDHMCVVDHNMRGDPTGERYERIETYQIFYHGLRERQEQEAPRERSGDDDKWLEVLRTIHRRVYAFICLVYAEGC
ncbi:hypothetical protein Bca4012_037806 [Brassica carinata]|uniref:Uncharacterized protein n=1 Tax=Brassica carinata TaxID=52824 RepID=A0A8X7WI43_BRACI|nr:hypothetical protein Bca52824_011436 [Brassica carinata]